MSRFAPNSLTQTLKVVTLLTLALTGLVMTESEVAAQGYSRTRVSEYDDFGPAPDTYLQERLAPIENGRLPRSYDRNKSGFGSRDPSARQRLRDLELEDNLPLPSQQFERRNRPTLPRINPQATEPVTPTKPATPTVSEKIARRYTDPRVIRIVQSIDQRTGEALYVEISQLIDSRHVQPSNYQQRVVSGLEHLQIALGTPSFQQAVGLSVNTQAVRAAAQQLQSLGQQVNAQSLNDAIGVMRQAGSILGQSLRVNPAVASLEFMYGALDTLDQYSMFVAPEKSGSTSLGLKENQVGIGVEIESHAQGLKILKALSGGPAAAATLQRGDIITAVDGKSVVGMDLSAAADMIAGAQGTPVQLGLRRSNMVGEVTLVRRPFLVQSVSEVRMESAGVGYIKLDQFAESSSKEMDAALWKLHNEGMQSLVLDLRGNPGGLLTTAIELSDRFLPAGTIVSTKGRTQADNTVETAQKANTWKVPLVVLIDHNSASASEIFAAAVQENGRGLIVGETSYGKGTVQTLFPLRSVSSALRLTTAKFYSPDGRAMAGVGVTPDLKVTGMTNSTEGNDRGLQAAVKAAVDPRVQEMASYSSRVGHQNLRVLRVAI